MEQESWVSGFIPLWCYSRWAIILFTVEVKEVTEHKQELEFSVGGMHRPTLFLRLCLAFVVVSVIIHTLFQPLWGPWSNGSRVAWLGQWPALHPHCAELTVV